MADIARIGLDGGGWLLLDRVDDNAAGPVKAGRVKGAIQEMPESLRTVLRPVVQASREVLEELRAAGPDEVKVEFAVSLAVSAGAAVLAKADTACHFKITLGWSGGEGGSAE